VKSFVRKVRSPPSCGSLPRGLEALAAVSGNEAERASVVSRLSACAEGGRRDAGGEGKEERERDEK